MLVPRREPGTKEGTRNAAPFGGLPWLPPQLLAASLGPRQPLGNWEGWTKGDDPRARRPASAVTQPMGGESIRSGVRSGDVKTDAGAVREFSPTTCL